MPHNSKRFALWGRCDFGGEFHTGGGEIPDGTQGSPALPSGSPPASPNRIEAVIQVYLPRLPALLLAVHFLLAAGAGEAFGYHPCPHHEAVPGKHGPLSAHAGHHVHGSNEHQPGTHGDPEQEAPCTCIGTCHGTAAAPFPAIAETEIRFVVRGESPPAPDKTAGTLSNPLAYLFPHANAPPIGR